MAETITEKAKAYSLEQKENAVFGYDEEDLEKSFLAGANHVLEKIEKCLNSNTNSRLKLDSIKSVIRELKGE